MDKEYLDKLVKLNIEYINLLYSGISYDDLYYLMQMDYKKFINKDYARRLIDAMCDVDSIYYSYDRIGIDIDSNLPYQVHEEECINTNITSRKDAGIKFLALKLADDIYKQKNTTLN